MVRTFGHSPAAEPNTGYATGTFSVYSNELDATKYNLSNTMTVASMSIAMYTPDSARKIRMGIYASVANAPAALLGYTTEYSGVILAKQIINLPLTAPLELTAGDYFLGIIANVGITPYGDDSGATTFYKAVTYAGSMPAPFPAGPTGYAKGLQIWATEAAAPAGWSHEVLGIASPSAICVGLDEISASAIQKVCMGVNEL